MDNLKSRFQDFVSCMIKDKLSNLKSENIVVNVIIKVVAYFHTG